MGEQGIGTVDHIEMPEGSLNIVNLVEVARFIEKSWGLSGSSDAVNDEDAEAEEYESEDQEEGECQADCESGCSTKASSTKELDAPRPIVYSGTFQDYKKGATKFTRFTTLTRLNRAVRAQTPPAQNSACSASFKLLSTIVPDILSDIMSQIEATREHRVIVDGSTPQGHVPCQFLALSTPPSMQKEGCSLTTLSDAIVEKMIKSTMAGAKRAARMIVGRDAPEVVPSCTPSPCAEEVDVLNVDPKRVYLPPKPHWHKFSFGHGSKDDACNWKVDTSSVKGPVAFVGSRRRSLSQRCSGSSWGGAGSLLEPICQGKLSLDQDFKVNLPALEGVRG